ncbi:hypothetical protein H2200_009534 [Cladophialophora chaetospira]|uniref:Major facilitator superfamily (MFS) profile domain-containing protein n=1 Tax=Cladophialophora chaetospira TaxID=386627 RepID=A0AA38X2Q1_9EURO|nr:hypothetical protein H2200_009534 [Cladophialophora chaetospira]
MEMNYGENELHQLELELQTDIYPGTEIMDDVGGRHFVKSSGKTHRVLVPQPSCDPHDPLVSVAPLIEREHPDTEQASQNWSPAWKASAIALSTITTFAQAFGPLSIAPMFPALMKAFDADLAGVVNFSGVLILCWGFSNFLWVPMQDSLGRRPVLLLSTAVCLAANLWRALSQDYRSFMAASVLNGIGAGPAEALEPAVIADVMFLHERGGYNTLYFAVYFGAVQLGAIIGGVMAGRVGWRSFFWLNVALLGAVFVAQLFLFPETKWHRLHPRELATFETEPTAPTSETDKNRSPHHSEVGNDSNTVHGEKDVRQNTTDSDSDPYLCKGYPAKSQFKLWQLSERPLRTVGFALWTPWKLFAFPIVELSAFIVSFSASMNLTVNFTQAQFFSVPPYNFSSEQVGYTNFAILAGTGIGLLTNGKLSDWIAQRATKRNKGIREPEMRLPAMLPYVLIMLLSNFIIAFGYAKQWNWQSIVIVGYTCAGIQVAAIPAIASTYAVDSYKPVAGSLFVAITVNKNLWGYGYSKFITTWSLSAGWYPPIMLNMCLICFFCACAIPFYFYGKTFRKWTRNSSVHSM